MSLEFVTSLLWFDDGDSDRKVLRYILIIINHVEVLI